MTFTKKLQRIAHRRLLLLALVVVIIGLYFIYERAISQKPAPDMSVIRRGDIESAVLATGILRPKNLVAIGSRASGRIVSLSVKPGQHVKKGDIVALIDPSMQQTELEKAQATLRQQEATQIQNIAELELAELDLARQLKLIGNNAVAKSEYEKAISTAKVRKAMLANSEAAIAAAKLDVKIKENDLEQTNVTAPNDGVVLAIVVQEGQTVNALQSAPTIAILGQLDNMTVEVGISEADISKVKIGSALYFTISGQNAKRYDAKLEGIYPAPDSILNDRTLSGDGSSSANAQGASSAIYYKGVFDVQNPDGKLKTYMTAKVHILIAEAKNVLLAPVSALRDSIEENTASVGIIDSDGEVIQHIIKTGISDKTNTEIRAGLNEGDKIVTDNGNSDSNDASETPLIGAE